MSTAAFAERHGRGYLSVHAGRQQQSAGFRTRSGATDAADEITASMDVGIMPLVRKPLSTNAFVCVGRLDGNDIHLPDETVSKLHAIVREERGILTLLDARSRNGTWIDGALVAARGEGEASQLKSGQVLRFGAVTTTFLDAEAVRQLCLHLAP